MSPGELLQFITLDKPVKIKYKDKSKFMKFLGFFLKPFNDGFMYQYITTIGHTVYFPSKAWAEKNNGVATTVMGHELIHVKDYERFGILFGLSFLFPQILVLGVFGVCFVQYSWWNLLWLLCTLFIFCSSPTRTYFEARGYAVTMVIRRLGVGSRYDFTDHANSISWQFTSPAYLWMCRNKSKVVDKLTGNYMLLMHGKGLPGIEKTSQEIVNYFSR